MLAIIRARSCHLRDYLVQTGILTRDQITSWRGSKEFQAPRPRVRSSILSTLIPEKLLPTDFVDASSKFEQSVRFGDVMPHDGFFRVHFRSSQRQRLQFPAHARGFFYLYKPSNMPVIASSIRFRCTQSSDPASFDQGEDLRGLYDLPWHISMVSILSHYSHLQKYVLRAGIMTELQIAKYRQIITSKSLKSPLCRLDQPFVINLTRYISTVDAIVGYTFGQVKVFLPKRFPYAGSLLHYLLTVEHLEKILS